jgi:Zn-finger nucleic acid-binding protein
VTDADVLCCPSCGASVAYGARRCAHCAASVATVRCAHCFHMSPSGAVHCAGCGRQLGLEPIAREGLPACPDCKIPMDVVDCGPGVLHDCGRCGGQFVEHDAMRDLVERHDRLDVVPRTRVAQMPLDTHVRYVACPACGALMNRSNFGANSGVIVDVCAKHGTWFDAGELPRVLSFIESGGLTRTRQRQAEEQARLKREQAAAAHPPPSLGSTLGADVTAGTGAPHVSVADLLASLFR